MGSRGNGVGEGKDSGVEDRDNGEDSNKEDGEEIKVGMDHLRIREVGVAIKAGKEVGAVIRVGKVAGVGIKEAVEDGITAGDDP